MQIIPSESIMPLRLTCSGCRHWQEITGPMRDAAESMGRCECFGETRAANARPRCNICWEPVPAAAPAQDDILTSH